MPTPATPPIDIVTVAVAVCASLFGAQVAEIVGPYSVIVMGAVLGAAWSTSRRDALPRLSALGHVLLMVALALLVSVPAAELLALHTPLASRWLLGPVAAVVAGIGQDWPAVLRWLIGLLRRRAEREIGGGPDGGTPGAGA
jgi:hypothetical protein